MFAVNNAHKINGNLSTTTATANTTATAGATTQSTTFTFRPKHPQQLHRDPSNVTLQQHNSTKVTVASTKLQAPQLHQRRSFSPSASLQQQPHQQIIAIPTSAVVTAVIPPQPNQLQTKATIHQPFSQTQQHNIKPRTGAVSSTQTSITSGTAENPITRRSFYNLQSSKAVNNPKATDHSIPPRYQPPPQPQSNTQPSSGILKNLNSQILITGPKTAYPYCFSELSGNHLSNTKYPSDIPQHSSVFIPDSLKNLTNSSSYLQQRQRPQNNQQTNFQQRVRKGNLANGHSLQQHQPVEIQQQQLEMLKFVRKTDQDHPSPNASVTSSGTGGIPPTSGCLTVEQNRQLQSLINEMRALKEQNQRLMDDSQELRDLCCFLDDDRQKGRKLAREWQRFGRYTASVMRQEVAAYQNKLRQLDDKQQELITDNLELKELCLYLDEERAHIAANSLCVNCRVSTRNILRDDGDGSSTNADENINALRNYDRQLPDLQLRSTLQDQTLQYVRSLERRIQQLEEERINNTTNATATTIVAAPTATIVSQQQNHPTQQQNHPTQQQLTSCVTSVTHNQKLNQQTSALNDGLVDPTSGRPEAVVRALQVLEVREQLERDRLGNLTGHDLDQMDDGEKALVREMCNVVWRKLEGSPTALETL